MALDTMLDIPSRMIKNDHKSWSSKIESDILQMLMSFNKLKDVLNLFKICFNSDLID
jgi:hypothetical protein